MPLSPVVEDVMRQKHRLSDARNKLGRTMLNFLAVVILLYDINTATVVRLTDLPLLPVYYSELFLLVVFTLNTLFDFLRYCWLMFGEKPVTVTEKQRSLMGITGKDVGFKLDSPKSVTPAIPSTSSLSESFLLHDSTPDLSTPLNMSTTSWLSSSPSNTGSPSFLSSPNLSVSSSSWMFQPGTPKQDQSLHNQSSTSAVSPSLFRSNVKVVDEDSLQQYLDEFEEREKRTYTAHNESSTSLGASFWNYQTSQIGLTDYSPLLRKYAYQLSCPSPGNSPGVSGNTSETSGQMSHGKHGDDVWMKLSVSKDDLFQWMENLRLWISQTILKRLVCEIASINSELRNHGQTDTQIGEAGLEKLRKAAQIAAVSQNIPSLTAVLPFLDATSNQEYLVQRLMELSADGCMSDFQWKSGGKFKGKPWEEYLPTDSAIVMHLVSTYFDTRLPSHPKHPDGKTFTNQHFLRTPDKPEKSKDGLVIYQSQIHPPNYKLVVGEEVIEVAKGRNNLFHTLLFFLHRIKTQHHGMLGRVSLGTSGINVLWVIE